MAKRSSVSPDASADLAAAGHLIRVKGRCPRLASNGGVRTPNIFFAYVPRGVGLRCAVAYLASERDVYGWFLGARDDGSLASAFFLLENFYTNGMTRYESVDEADLHSHWSLDEPRRHELAVMQEAVAREWLCYGEDADVDAYDIAELAVGAVNLRYAKLAKFSKLQPNWTYYSERFERRVLNFLARRWPLDYRPDED